MRKKKKKNAALKITVREDGTRIITLGAGIKELKHTPPKKKGDAHEADATTDRHSG